MLCLYAVQFFVFPWMFPVYFRISNEATALYWLSFAFVVVIGVWMNARKLSAWLPGNVLYLICVRIYSANGAYNAQLNGHSRTKWFVLVFLIYLAELVIFQLAIILLTNMICKAIKCRKQ